jgi:potassium intermediate/small conductance calcium-activated channel subfamily N protein 2
MYRGGAAVGGVQSGKSYNNFMGFLKEKRISPNGSQLKKPDYDPVDTKTQVTQNNDTDPDFNDESNFYQRIMTELNEKKESTLEDGRVTKAYFDRLKMVETGSLLMCIIGIGLSVVQYELEFSDIHYMWSYALLWLIFLSSLILAVMTFIRYMFSITYAKKRNMLPGKANLITTGRWKLLIIEMIFCVLGPLPFTAGIRFHFTTLYSQLPVYMNVNELLALFMFFRVLIIVRVTLLNSRYSSNRSQRICEMYACEAGFMYTIKCIMKAMPFTVITCAMCVSLPAFAWMLRICERPIARVPNQPFSYDSYWNAMWNVVVTITTVGYGDYFAQTFLGRFVIFFVAIWGVFVVSMMVVTLTNALIMTPLEIKAFTVFQKLTFKEELKEESASIFTGLAKARIASRKKKYGASNQYLANVGKHIKAFRKLNRRYKEEAGGAEGFEEMARHFDFLRDSMKDVHKQQKFLMESNRILMGMIGVDRNVIENLNAQLLMDSKKLSTNQQIPLKPNHHNTNSNNNNPNQNDINNDAIDLNLTEGQEEDDNILDKQTPY